MLLPGHVARGTPRASAASASPSRPDQATCTRSRGTAARRAARASRPGAPRVQRLPRRKSQSPSRQPVTSTPSAPRAQRVLDERRRQLRRAEAAPARPCAVGDAPRIRRRRARSQPKTTMAGAARGARAARAPRRVAPAARAIGACGRSMPVASVGDRAERRRRRAGAGADAAAGAQIRDRRRPAAAGACRRCAVASSPPRTGSRRSSVRSRCSWRGRRPRRPGAAARRLRRPGQGEQQQRERADGDPQRGRRCRVGERVNAEVEPVERAAFRAHARGRRARRCATGQRERQQRSSAAACPRRAPAAGSSPAATPLHVHPHRASSASGMPMCRKISSEKKRSLTAPAAMKLRISAPPNTGSASSHSVVATRLYCASVPHQPEAADARREHQPQREHAGDPREPAEVRVAAEEPFARTGARA